MYVRVTHAGPRLITWALNFIMKETFILQFEGDKSIIDWELSISKRFLNGLVHMHNLIKIS